MYGGGLAVEFLGASQPAAGIGKSPAVSCSTWPAGTGKTMFASSDNPTNPSETAGYTQVGH